MRKLLILSVCSLLLGALRVNAEEIALLRAKKLTMTPTGGVVRFVREPGTTNLPDPTCPGISSIRFMTSKFDTGDIVLDCSKWQYSKGRYTYSDPAGLTAVTEIKWKSTRLDVKFGGTSFDFSDLLGPVTYWQFEFRVGPDKDGFGPDAHCARFDSSNFLINLASKIDTNPSIPSKACVYPQPSTPTHTRTITPTPGPSNTRTTTPTRTVTPTFNSSQVAFRVTSLSLNDPGIVISGCTPVNALVNSIISGKLTSDSDSNGYLDLSLVQIFKPLDQTNGGGGDLDAGTADCTYPASTTSCANSSPSGLQSTTYTSSTTSTCLETIPNTLGANHGNTPIIAIQIPTAPCFSSPPITSTFNLGGILVPLSGAQFAAQYNGDPATSLQKGLIRGFISEATAQGITLPADLPLVGGKKLSEILRGASNCPTQDDRDCENPNQSWGSCTGATGWWFYLNYTASPVPFTY